MSKLIIGNLKMNLLSPVERERYFADFKKLLKGKKFPASRFILCPPAVHLEAFGKSFNRTEIGVGAQNVFWEERGSFTGEVSAAMAKNLGAEYAIVGHSERRRYFGETDEMANLKIQALLKTGMRPILCVGETREEREAGMMKERIEEQLAGGLSGIPGTRLDKIIIAYEPVWAVGTDTYPTSNEVMEARILIKKLLLEMYGPKNAEKVTILYGGSVKAKYVWQLCLEPGMGGVLVGRESLIPQELVRMAEIINQ